MFSWMFFNSWGVCWEVVLSVVWVILFDLVGEISSHRKGSLSLVEIVCHVSSMLIHKRNFDL